MNNSIKTIMRSTFKILFYINRQKTKADGNTAILCRITIDGKNTAITTGEECHPVEWNTKQGLTTNKKTNQRIKEFRDLVEKTYRDILVKDGVKSFTDSIIPLSYLLFFNLSVFVFSDLVCNSRSTSSRL